MAGLKTIFSFAPKARSRSVLISLSMMVLVFASSAFTFYGARPEGADPQTSGTPLPVKVVDAPVRLLQPAPTASDPLAPPIADHFDYPVASPNDWVIQQGFAPSYNPYGGGLHTGEDWIINPQLRDERGQPVSTIHQPVQAVAPGSVRYASMVGYPCGVVILEHTLPDGQSVYSMYAHIEALTVVAGEWVAGGQVLGRICAWPGDRSNSHLHFEIRSFYIKDQVNGENAACLYRHRNFPPGPGYWPVCGSHWLERPADEGWLNPSDFILAHHAAAPTDLAVLDASAIRFPLQTPVPLP